MFVYNFMVYLLRKVLLYVEMFNFEISTVMKLDSARQQSRTNLKFHCFWLLSLGYICVWSGLKAINNKEWLCSNLLKGLGNCYAHVSVHSPMWTLLHAQQFFVRYLVYVVFVQAPLPVHAWSLCSQWSSVVHMHVPGSLVCVVVPFYFCT